jgi:hypothetical protein
LKSNTLADAPPQLPSHSNWSSIYLARRFAVVSTGLCWYACCAAKQTVAAAFNAVLRATAVGIRSAPTVSYDEGAPLVARHRGHFKRIVR